jgi:GST-like protein
LSEADIMMDLYTAAAPNARRATLILEELELPYRIHNIDLAGGEHKKPPFLSLNPLGYVPVLRDPDGPGGKPIVLCQSAAILLYLAEKTGRLLPKDPMAHLEALQQFSHVMTDIAAMSTGLFMTLRTEPESRSIAPMQARMRGYLAVMDARLADRDFICGDMSVVDVALLPVAILPHVKPMVAEAPRVARWSARMQARPAVARAINASPHH